MVAEEGMQNKSIRNFFNVLSRGRLKEKKKQKENNRTSTYTVTSHGREYVRWFLF